MGAKANIKVIYLHYIIKYILWIRKSLTLPNYNLAYCLEFDINQPQNSTFRSKNRYKETKNVRMQTFKQVASLKKIKLKA